MTAPATPEPAEPNAARTITNTITGTPPSCPRCAYDLSVATQLWPEDRCHTQGLCTECGLTFSWGDVLNATLAPWWLIEHNLKGFRVIKALFGSIFVPLVPQQAMRALPLTLPVFTKRALLMPIVLFAMWYLIGALAFGFEHFVGQRTSTHSFFSVIQPTTPSGLDMALWVFADASLPYYINNWNASVHGPLISPAVLIIAVHCVLMPLSFLTLRVTLKRVKVRRAHFVRLYAVALCPMIALMMVALIARTTLSALDYTGVWSVQQDWLVELVEWHFMFRIWNWPMSFLIAYLIWILVYWYSACRWYLRLPSPFFHSMMLFIVASLGTLTLLHFFSQSVRGVVIDAMSAIM